LALKLNEMEERIVKFLRRRNKPQNISEIANGIGATDAAVSNTLDVLDARNLVDLAIAEHQIGRPKYASLTKKAQRLLQGTSKAGKVTSS
jgi:DNA-binding MarR family transcriptional regulator